MYFKKNNNILFYIFGLVFPVFLLAQNPELHFNFQKLSLEDGLNDDRNNCFIFQDSKGFVWISSIDGLNRFDGTNVKTYRFESGLQGKNIQSNFYEDNQSNIWFSTYEEINCYIRKEDSIKIYRVKDSLGVSIMQNYRVFHVDTANNHLWLQANKQIFCLDIDNPHNYFALAPKIEAYDFNVLYNEDKNLTKIVASPWLYGNGNGIDFFYLKDSILVDHKKYLQQFKSLRKSIYLQDASWLFFKENESLLLLFNEIEPEKVQFLKNDLDFSFRDITKFKDDYLLLSTIDNGIWLYNWRTEKYLRQWKNKANNRYSLLTNEPRELHILNDYLWLYHNNQGVNYTYLYNNHFENPLEKVIPKNAEIASINKVGQDAILIGTKYNGIYLFSYNGELLKYYSLPSSKPKLSELWQASIHKDGNIFCTTSKAIYFFDLETTNVLQIIEKPEDIKWRFIGHVFPNRTLVSSTIGIKEIFKNSNGKYEIGDCPEFTEFPNFTFVQFFQASNHKLYVPYNSSELWVYQASYQGLKLIKKIKCNIEFFGFCESKKKSSTILAGTSRGLFKIVNDTIIQFVTSGDALLNNSNIYGIVEDNYGKFWLGTNQGLWKYDEEAIGNKLLQFNEVDGLSGDFFSLYNSSLLTNNSDIWMGNNKGLVKFNPNQIKPYTKSPKVYISELTINDTEVYKGIGEQDNLELNYDQNTLTFDILALNLIKPEQNKIIYRLRGYDDSWLSVTNNQRIRYTKIPHGKYNFEVKAIDANGNQSATKKLAMKINPPFWKTWWFCAIAILTFAFLIYLIYRYRINQLIKEEEKKTTLEKLKNQLLEVEMKALRAQMNPHFLFNAMNSIKGIITKGEEAKAASYLTKFSSLLRSILANSEKKKIILAKEIEALKLYIELESLRFTTEFNYQIQIDKNIDTSFTRIPPLILQPFVENAIWHGLIAKSSGVNKLNVNIFRENDFVILEVEDNGVGRKKKATSNKPKKQKSMGIGITQKRAELLHSENEIRIIDLVDNTGNAIGTKVSIKLYAPE